VVRVVEVPVEVPVTVPDPIHVEARSLNEYRERTAQLAPAALAEEIQHLSAGPGTPSNTLRLAVALSLTGASVDCARALALLQPIVGGTVVVEEPWRTLGALVAANVADLRRLQERNERQAQQLRESQRRLDDASQKLDALRAIERSLDSRGVTGAAPPPR
jgi:hypothetical protein